ncbi:MAG: pyridoxine 5'-phosphate synthase [Gemmatimonadetes bacterium]|nr:MAG: pyridoxine 5'-phosphate synthase [Gemmatimonadota bacterium]
MRLYVNIDHVATVREARRTDEPDPVRAAELAERGGADGITVHLREDRRHIQDADVRALARRTGTVLNLELGASPAIVRIAGGLKPHQATLVPENRREITTEGGLALARSSRRLQGAVRRLQDAGLRVSLFIDPTREAVARAAELGVPAVELHTGRYAHGWRRGDAALRQLRDAAARAKRLGLAVHAGHGLTYENVQPVAAIPELEELNIGHSIVSNAIYWGLEEAVRRMKELVVGCRSTTVADREP